MVAGSPAKKAEVNTEEEFELNSPEFTAWITVGPTQEKGQIYSIKQDLKSISGSIESIEGQEFKIHFRDERLIKSTGVVAALILDGEQMESFNIVPRSPSHVAVYTGKRISDNEIRPYCFSKVQLTDDLDLFCDDESVVKALGTIKLLIRRSTLQPHVTPTVRYYAPEKSKVMNEKSKKAQISHTTGLGAATYAPPANSCSVIYHDEATSPYFVMEFVYRSRALLEIAGLITSPEPIAGPSNSKKRAATGVIIIDSSDDEDDELVRLRAENQQLKKKAKQEKEDKKPFIKGEGVEKIEKGTVIIIEDD